MEEKNKVATVLLNSLIKLEETQDGLLARIRQGKIVDSEILFEVDKAIVQISQELRQRV